MNIEKIANELARLMKGAGDDDAGNFAHFFDDEVYDKHWDAVCDRADELLPTIRVTAAERAMWSSASRDFASEQRAEQRAFCPH